MEPSSVQSSCTRSSLPLLRPCSCCSSAALSGLRQVATTLQDGLHAFSKCFSISYHVRGFRNNRLATHEDIEETPLVWLLKQLLDKLEAETA